METRSTTPPAQRTFCVWADYVRRVYQHVEATTAKQAHDEAKRQPDCWESCAVHDSNGYRLSNEVQDLESEEFVPIHGSTHCKTCGSELVETINDSLFREGECGPCEYERYHSQPALLGAVREAKEYIENALAFSGCDAGEGEMINRWNQLIRAAQGNAE